MCSSSLRRGVVIVAAGSGERYGDPAKVLIEVCGLPLLLHSVRAFRAIPTISRVTVVLGAHTFEAGAQALERDGDGDNVAVAIGGATRSESVRAGLAALSGEADLVAVHDAARPLVSPQLIESVFAAAGEQGAAVPALPVSDTLVAVDVNGRAYAGTVDRHLVRAAQTPQAARLDWLMDALAASPDETDEGSALARAGYPVALVAGDPRNLKVTWPADLRLVEALMGRDRAS